MSLAPGHDPPERVPIDYNILFRLDKPQLFFWVALNAPYIKSDFKGFFIAILKSTLEEKSRIQSLYKPGDIQPLYSP